MRLFVGHHLQTMLDGAQEIVSGSKLVARLRVDPAVGCERRKRDDGAPVAQFGVPSTGNQLLSLNKEFNLANAAAAKLYVVTFDRDLTVKLGRGGKIGRAHV